MRTLGHIHDSYGQQQCDSSLFARQGRLLRKTAYPKNNGLLLHGVQIKTHWMMNQEFGTPLKQEIRATGR